MAIFQQWDLGSMKTKNSFKEFVFFSAGPVGDHVILIDFAHRFFESSGIPSCIIMKHPNPFLRDFALPYYDCIRYEEFPGFQGKVALVYLMFSSIFVKRCFINVLPIPAPTYYKVFAYFIRFCTRSRFVGFNLEASRNFPQGKGSSVFLGKENYIDAQINKNIFHEEANRMLAFLGFPEIQRAPSLAYIEDKKSILNNSLISRRYIVFHLAASHVDRSFPEDKWNRIIKAVQEKLPNTPLVFTGSEKDRYFIETCLGDISRTHIILACGSSSTQQLLTLHANALLNVTVHTGNAHFINMLHVPTLTLNIKGVYFFKFYYNELGRELVATEGCTCDPFERECTMIPYKGKEYMACLFNIKEENIVENIISMITPA